MDEKPLGRGPESWSDVRTHGRTIRYRRSGTGRTVLLLGAGRVSGLAEALEPLAAWFRLIVPDPPDTHADRPDWIAELIDGLGTPKFGIVAAGALRAAAIAMTGSDPDRVRGLVLVGGLPAPVSGEEAPVLAGSEARVHSLNPGLLADARGLVVITGFLAESGVSNSLDRARPGSLS